MSRKEVFITSHPRSGNAWLHRLLADALSAPLQTWRDRAVLTEFSESTGGPYLVRKAHVTGWEADNAVIHERGTVIWLHRDPRDVTISQMYFRRKKPIEENVTRVIWSNMRPPPEIAPAEYKDMPIMSAWIYSYWDHPERYDIEARYEWLHERGVEELQRLVEAITGERMNPKVAERKWKRHQFQSVKNWGPKMHTEGSMRKGVVGDWRNHFKRHHGELFAKGFNDLLLEVEYEDDLDWWKELPE